MNLRQRLWNIEANKSLNPDYEVIFGTSESEVKRKVEERKAENPHAHFILRIHSPVNKPVRAGLGAM